MTDRQTTYGCNIVQFPRRGAIANCLTKQDRQEVASFMSQAEAAGYDALIIHVMKPAEYLGTADYISAYRPGEAWSTWGFARDGDTIRVWNALTSEDAGDFPSLHEALQCTLVGALVPMEQDNTIGHRPAAAPP